MQGKCPGVNGGVSYYYGGLDQRTKRYTVNVNSRWRQKLSRDRNKSQRARCILKQSDRQVNQTHTILFAARTSFRYNIQAYGFNLL